MGDFPAAYDAVLADANTLARPLTFGRFDAMRAAIAAKLTVLERFEATLDALQGMARDVLGVLTETVTVPCIADYVAALWTGALVLGDGVEALRAADYANEHMAIARYLWTEYADLLHLQAVEDCA